MGDSTLDKRCVVLTRESMFYVPKENTPISAPATPQKTEAKRRTGDLSETPRKAEEEDDTSTFKTAQVIYTYGIRLLALALLILLLALLYFYKRDTLAWNSVFGLIGVCLGYTLAWAQGTTKNGVDNSSRKKYHD